MEKLFKVKNLSAKIYLPDRTPKEIVIGIHGFFGDKESSVLANLGETLIKNNMALVIFDLPCHGHNDTSQILKLSDCTNAINDVFNWVHENFPNIALSVFATSFGGYLTLLYLSQNKEDLNKIILRAPAVNMSQVLEDVLLPFQALSAKDLKTPTNIGKEQNLWIDYNFIEELRNNRLQNANPTNNFLYVLQGKRDDIVNPEENEKFFNEFYENKHEIIYFENADHRFKKPGELERIIDETLTILK